MKDYLIGKQVIVRSHMAGVFYGECLNVEFNNTHSPHILLRNARRIWAWEGACSLTDISVGGVQKESRITHVVEWELVFDVIEVLPLTEAGKKNLDQQSVWTVVPAKATNKKERHVNVKGDE